MFRKVMMMLAAGTTAVLMSANELSVDISRNTSMAIKGKNVDVSVMSDIIAVIPPWRGERINRDRCQYEVTKSEDGKKVISVQTGGPEFNDISLEEFSIAANGNEAIITMHVNMKNDVPTKMFYQMLMIPDYLLSGAYYTAVLADGQTVNGKIPENPASSTDVIELVNKIRSITLKSYYGTLTVAVEKGPELTLFERRANSVYNPIRGFEIGARWDVKFGDDITSVVKVVFEETALTPAKPLPEAKKSQSVKIHQAKLATPLKPDYSNVPPPRQVEKFSGSYLIRPGAAVRINAAEITDFDAKRLNKAAVRILKDNFPELRTGNELRGNAAKIVLNIGKNDQLPKAEDSYIINIGDNDIDIYAHTPRGAFYAMHTLNMQVNNGSIAKQKITDWPDYDYRGIHLLLDNASIAVTGPMIEHLFAPLKINNLVTECQYVKWDATPELHQKWAMSKEDVRKLKEIADDNFMEFTPLFQTLGHSEWLFANGQHKDLAEYPDSPYAYNQTAPNLYPLMDSILDEVIETFGQPKKLHIGHDEVYHPQSPWPSRPENVAKGGANLFFDDVMHYYDYAKKRNMDIIMWHDMIVTQEECPENGAGGEPDNVASLRGKLPKDIYIAFWRYTAGYPFTDVDKVYGEGYTKLLGATWYDLQNIVDMAAAGRGKLEGFLQTTWTGYNGNATAVREQFMQIHPYAQLALSSWNSYLPLKAVKSPEIYCGLMEAARPQNSYSGWTVDISDYANITMNPAENVFMAGMVYNMDTLPLPSAKVGGVEFRLAEREQLPAAITVKSRIAPLHPVESPEVPVNEKVQKLYFLHSSISAIGKLNDTVANYQVTYDDNSTELVPVRYGVDIGALLSDVNFDLSPLHALSWNDSNGGQYRMWYQTWTNPHPEKTVKSVKLAANATEFPIYWFGLSAAQAE